VSNIVITGCAGFIGSHAADLFLEKGFSVFGIDCLTYASCFENMNNAMSYDNFLFAQEDICNTDSILDICKKNDVEYILNFAAESHVDNSINNAYPFLRSNVQGVLSLLEVCRRSDTKIFQISTDEVYGSSSTYSFLEKDKLDPRNPYSASKAAAEHFVTSYSNTHGIGYKMVRMSNNFGPRQHNEKLLPTAIRALASCNRVPIYGDGKNIRDWFYVKDCVKMIHDVFYRGKENEIYNLTYNNEMNNLFLITKLCNIMKKNPQDSIEFVDDRPGHDFRYSISNEKIKGIGIGEPTNFYKALEETIDSIVF